MACSDPQALQNAGWIFATALDSPDLRSRTETSASGSTNAIVPSSGAKATGALKDPVPSALPGSAIAIGPTLRADVSISQTEKLHRSSMLDTVASNLPSPDAATHPIRSSTEIQRITSG